METFLKAIHFFMKCEDVFSNERIIKKGFFSKQPSNALSALIGRFQTYYRCKTFKLSLKE